MNRKSFLYMDTRPRVVSIYELLAKLLPHIEGYAWAEDALMDLWLMGAPEPSLANRACLEGHCQLEARQLHKCLPKWGCARIKRILLPAQFAVWWLDVAQRQGLELTAQQALEGRIHKKFGKGQRQSTGGRQVTITSSGQNGNHHRGRR